MLTAFAADQDDGITFLYAVGNITRDAFERLVISMCQNDPEAAPHGLDIHQFESEEELRQWTDGGQPKFPMTWPQWGEQTKVSRISYEYAGGGEGAWHVTAVQP